jgi:transcriptional regulator with XRE-family HTH domain
MTFGERIRGLRTAKGLTLRNLAAQVGVGFTYLSRIETGRMTYGEYPSEVLIRKLADALSADEDELLLRANKIPETIRRRVLQRPDAFRTFAACDDETLDRLVVAVRQTPVNDAPSKRRL